MVVGRIINKFINIFTGLFGIITLVLMLIIYINYSVKVGDNPGILPEAAMEAINRARNYFTLATVFCAGAEFTLKRNVILAIIFACIVAGVAAFMVYADFAI